MIKFRSTSGVAALALAIAIASPAAGQEKPQSTNAATDTAPADTSSPAEDDIVVTALKRGPQTLTNTPAAVSVIDGKSMEDAGARSLVDVLGTTPAVSITDTNFAGGTSISIRGANATFGAATVGFYLDDLPFSLINQNFLPDPSPYDLDRVEILRGPQGSLYGAGTSGGVVLVHTKDPVLGAFEEKGEGRVSSTQGGGTNYMGGGALNVPIGDDIALRVSGSYNDDAGWIEAPNRNLTNYNYSRRLNLRGKLLFAPTDRLKIQFQGAASRIDADGTNSADGANKWYALTNTRTSTDYDQVGAVVNYDFGGAALTSTSSYLNWRSAYDAGFVAPIPTTLRTKIFAQEVRLSSTTKSDFSWLVGAFYKNGRVALRQDLSGLGSPFNVDDDTRSEQYTVYGEGTLALLDRKVEVTLGGSYFHDATNNSSDFRPVLPNLVLNHNSTNRFSPKATLAVHPVRNTTVYATYSRGFRPATVDVGFSTFLAQSVVPTSTGRVDAEDLTAYEVGFKGDVLNNALHFEGAFFHNDIKNIQQSAAVVVPGTVVAANTVLNAGDARTTGFEWLLGMHPVRSLSVDFSGSYTKSEIKRNFYAPGTNPATATPLFFAGTPLNQVPEWSVAVSVAQSHNIGSLIGKVSTSLQYASKRPFTVLSQLPQYGQDNLRLDARYELGTKHWTAFVFVENLTNNQSAIAPSFYTPYFSLLGFPQKGITASRFRPRTIGGGVRFNF
ncbi:MAG: TonB-dependent receptor [Sphingomonas sp.]|uniref:TonB-dependent receptor n=1 Tax=Sphingomonas sp. TaxID=28214 RepID=UPI003F7D66B1